MGSFQTGRVENYEVIFVDRLFTGIFSIDKLQILQIYPHNYFIKVVLVLWSVIKVFILFPKCVYSCNFLSSVRLLAAIMCISIVLYPLFRREMGRKTPLTGLWTSPLAMWILIPGTGCRLDGSFWNHRWVRWAVLKSWLRPLVLFFSVVTSVKTETITQIGQLGRIIALRGN